MNLDEWLASAYGLPQGTPPEVYAPTSPAGSLTSHIAFDNPYVDHQSPPPYTPQANITPVDSNVHPSINATINPVLSANGVTDTLQTGYSAVMVPNHLVEATGRILMYLVQIVEMPEVPQVMDANANEQSGGLMATEQEIAELESIPESDHDPTLPRTIDDIRVTANPRPREIAELIDFKRAGPSRRAFYLARTKADNYYWFSTPRTERSSRLNKLIGDYCYKARNPGRKVHSSERRLRSGRVVRK
jgi:hypothetical protein